MRVSQFLQKLIDHELDISKRTYHSPEDRPKLEGCIAGLIACAKQPPDKFGELLVSANTALSKAYQDRSPQYWHVAMFHSEVETVCDVVSALFKSMNREPIIEPSKQAYRTMQMLLAGQADVVIEVANSKVGSERLNVSPLSS